MSVFVGKDKLRIGLLFLFIGTVVCLFCGEFNTIIFHMLPFDMRYFTSNFTPLFEEIFKALPILVFAFLFRPEKKTLLESSVLVGVGFAMLENAFILGGAASYVSVTTALIRGFGSGMMHGVATLTVGYGMTFVHQKRKLFYTGTTALLIVATIYHSIYNTLVQSNHQITGFMLPLVTFVPLLFLINKDRAKSKG